MADRSIALIALALFACSIPSAALAEKPTHIEGIRGLPDHCENYTSNRDFGPRVEQLLASCRIHFIDSFGHAAPLGVSRVVPGGLAAEVGLLNGDIIVQAPGVASHAARPPLWFFCLVDSGYSFDMRVQRYAGRQITLTFPGLSED
jgi:hypothetical protein